MRLTIGLAQIYPKLADLSANLDKHLAYVEQAAAQGVQLLVFPELSLTGYQVQDLVPEVAITTRPDDPVFARLLDASRRLDLMVGFVHQDARQRFYTASAYLSGGELLHVHHKIYLPTYGMFDESRYFDHGERAQAFDTPFGRVGMLICEDFWHMSPAYLLWLDGADLLLFQSASPSRGLDAGDRLSGSRWVELVNQAYG
ncbi:MAG: carbon-nitrogen hydrolase, partial [Anaerolineae bacterium]|nr:carbon-nitrogen hydrolase [Anaerolineae bacterium]